MRTTQQMSITLPNELALAVRAKVTSGEYASESEVIRDGLRVLMARDRAVDLWLKKQVEEQLAELYRYIEENATSTVALNYTSAVVEYCEGLATFPMRGTPRDDVRPGLRTTAYKRRTEIAYTVDEGRVSIIGVFHGGRDYETALQTDEPED
jgi:toxin ParE1/3/4